MNSSLVEYSICRDIWIRICISEQTTFAYFYSQTSKHDIQVILSDQVSKLPRKC